MARQLLHPPQSYADAVVSVILGQYHWVSEFAPRSAQKILSYIVGWFSILAWAAGGVAGQCFSVGLQVQGLMVLNDATYVPQPWHLTLLAIGAVAVCVVFNTLFARKLPTVESVMLVFHIIGAFGVRRALIVSQCILMTSSGFFAILIPLWVLAPKASSKEVWTGLQVSSGWSSTGLSFMVGVAGSLNGLIGPDAAVHMSEEVRDASRVVPKAMLWTLAMNGLSGLVMATTFAYCLGPLEDAVAPQYGFAFIGTFLTATKSKAGTTVMTLIITIMALCSAIDNVATGSRQLFAFARDGGVPFGRTLSYVIPGWDIPLNAICLVAFIGALLTLINLGSTVAFNALLSLGVVSLLGSYLISISCILIKRLRGEELLPRRFSLGASGLICNVLGVAFLAIAFLFALFPLGVPVTPENMNWASAVYGGVGILAFLYYFAYGRHGYVPPVARLAKDL